MCNRALTIVELALLRVRDRLKRTDDQNTQAIVEALDAIASEIQALSLTEKVTRFSFDDSAAMAAEAAPTVQQLATYRERVSWLKGSVDMADLKARATDDAHLAEMKKLTPSQVADLRSFYHDLVARLKSGHLWI